MVNNKHLRLLAAATATIGLFAVAESGSAGASASLKQCGHVDGTVAVTVLKGTVSCKTARAVAKAYDKQHTIPSGFTCKRHKVNAGAGYYAVCKKGTKSIQVTPE
jgi:L-fucose isomerase-like protein